MQSNAIADSVIFAEPNKTSPPRTQIYQIRVLGIQKNRPLPRKNKRELTTSTKIEILHERDKIKVLGNSEGATFTKIIDTFLLMGKGEVEEKGDEAFLGVEMSFESDVEDRIETPYRKCPRIGIRFSFCLRVTFD